MAKRSAAKESRGTSRAEEGILDGIREIDAELVPARERVAQLEDRRSVLSKALSILRGETDSSNPVEEAAVQVSAPTRPRQAIQAPATSTRAPRATKAAPKGATKPAAAPRRAAVGDRLIDRCAAALRKLGKVSSPRDIAAHLREDTRRVGICLSQNAARKELVAVAGYGLYRLIEWPKDPKPPVEGNPASKPSRQSTPRKDSPRSSGPTLQDLANRRDGRKQSPAPAKAREPSLATPASAPKASSPRPVEAAQASRPATPKPAPPRPAGDLLPNEVINRAVDVLRQRDRLMSAKDIGAELGMRTNAEIDRLGSSLSALAGDGKFIRQVGNSFGVILGGAPRRQKHELHVGDGSISCVNCGEERETRSEFERFECAA
jgi:hypothetical protein